MTSSRSEPDDVWTRAAERLEETTPDGAGPVAMVASDSATESPGQGDYQITAHRLVAVDPADPDLADLYVAVSVTGHATIAEDGQVEQIDLAAVDPGVEREVRAWARSLVASGAVRGLAAAGPRYGPPARPTHEICDDSHGRRVLRRIGFATS